MIIPSLISVEIERWKRLSIALDIKLNRYPKYPLNYVKA